MQKRELLLLDGVGNMLLGVILLGFPIRLTSWLGIPDVTSRFYPSLFGAVLVGIGIALLMEYAREQIHVRGLGLGGALIINTCFGVVLAIWLLFAGYDLPTHGSAILWALVLVLLGLSGFELAAELRKQVA